MLEHALYSQIEMPMNAYLSTLDSAALAQLNDTVLSIMITGINVSFTMHFQQGRVNVSAHYDSTPTISITGTPLAFCRLAMTEARTLAMQHDLQLEGDLTKAQMMMDVLSQPRINWTAWMRAVLGDQATHVVDETVSQVRSHVSIVHASLTRHLSEYLHEEALLLPPKEALNDFYDDVDAMISDVDRLEARIAALSSAQTKDAP